MTRETIASAFATPPAWGGYAGRNFETELASFGAWFAQGRESAICPERSLALKKRTVTVDVLVWFNEGPKRQPRASCTSERLVQADRR